MAFTTLISTAVLDMHLDDPAFAIVDCRYKLDDASWGEREYAAAHIPGAVYADLDRDLVGSQEWDQRTPPVAGCRTRWHRRSAASASRAACRWSRTTRTTACIASRLWWMLRWLGHDAVAVLDGGFAKWTAEGRPTESGAEPRAPREFSGAPRARWRSTSTRWRRSSATPGWRLVDARAPERFRGETEPIDKAAGHIPGAANHFFQWNLDEQGLFRTPEELRARIAAVARRRRRPIEIVCYCGSGVTACHNLLALEHAGLKGAKLYAGSWSEWSSDPRGRSRRGNRECIRHVIHSPVRATNLPEAGRTVFARHGIRAADLRVGSGRHRSGDRRIADATSSSRPSSA